MNDTFNDPFNMMFESILQDEMNYHLCYETNDKVQKYIELQKWTYQKDTEDTKS